MEFIINPFFVLAHNARTATTTATTRELYLLCFSSVLMKIFFICEFFCFQLFFFVFNILCLAKKSRFKPFLGCFRFIYYFSFIFSFCENFSFLFFVENVCVSDIFAKPYIINLSDYSDMSHQMICVHGI